MHCFLSLKTKTVTDMPRNTCCSILVDNIAPCTIHWYLITLCSSFIQQAALLFNAGTVYKSPLSFLIGCLKSLYNSRWLVYVLYRAKIQETHMICTDVESIPASSITVINCLAIPSCLSIAVPSYITFNFYLQVHSPKLCEKNTMSSLNRNSLYLRWYAKLANFIFTSVNCCNMFITICTGEYLAFEPSHFIPCFCPLWM